MRPLIAFLLISLVFNFAHAQGSTPDPLPSPTPPFTAEAEAGTVMVTGNSDSQSYATKGKAVYVNASDSYTAFGHYIQLKANGIESALNWDAGLRYERKINDYFGAYLGYKAESDVYAGYLQRDSTDIGGKYALAKTDTFSWNFELGYRYSKTQPQAGNPLYENFGRLYTELNKSYDKTYSLKYWAEYLPNFTNNEGYQVNTEASGNVMLTSVFSLKLAYLLQYLNVPPSGGKHSTATTTLNLVAKF
jgi:putative salt-induced outer membrane protein